MAGTTEAMHLTRRSWELISFCGLCSAVGVLGQAPLWIYLVIPIAAAFVSYQVHTARSFAATYSAMSVQLEPTKESAEIEESVVYRLRVHAPTPHPRITVTVTPPVAAETPDEPQTLSLAADTDEASLTFQTRVGIAGTHEMPAPRIDFSDRHDLLTASAKADEPSSMTILPAVPRKIHIGQGGAEVAAFGEHETDQQGTGIQPAELRQYQPGDTSRHIDWKATARLNEPYVREFEAETDRQTIILLDQRDSMAVGPEGRTMFAYAREVAMSLATKARDYGDPLGLYTVEQSRLTVQPPATTPSHYQRIRDQLLNATVSAKRDGYSKRSPLTLPRAYLDRRLTQDESALTRTVSPFLSRVPRRQSTTEQPLMESIRRIDTETTGRRWIVLLTSDRDTQALRQALERIRSTGDFATVFLTPSVLFEEGALSNLERAYERYREFERVRQQLAEYPHVETYEIAPQDRLRSVLTSHRNAGISPS